MRLFDTEARDVGLLTSERSKDELTIPLVPDFRFAYEPLYGESPEADDAARFVGRRTEISELGSRLALSTGGAFLITGYRGVGKTSFVNRVIGELRKQEEALRALYGAPVSVVDVRITLARPMKPVEVMHHIIRGLYRRLKEMDLLRTLDARLRADLELAFRRSSHQIKTTSSSVFGGEAVLPVPSWLVKKLSFKGEDTSTEEMQFNSYEEKVAEEDIVRLSHRLAQPCTGWRKLAGLVPIPGWRSRTLKIVFVFDELDKMTSGVGQDEAGSVDELLEVLKSVLTTSGISFVFIAGKDIDDRWYEDVRGGDSVYESVFGYNRYLELMWEDEDVICDRLVSGVPMPETTSETSVAFAPTTLHTLPGAAVPPQGDGWGVPPGMDAGGTYRDFKRYLAFHGRGIPRRILRALYQHVGWDGKRPYLQIARREYRRIKFFADLHLVLERAWTDLQDEPGGYESRAARDHQRLSLYYLVDWMVRRCSRAFTKSEAVRASRSLNQQIALAEDVAADEIARIIDVLVMHRILEEVPIEDVARVQEGVEPEREFRLREERVAQLGPEPIGFAEEKRLFAAVGREVAGLDGPGRVGEFDIQSEIGQGGFGKVFRAAAPDGRTVAVKILDPRLVKEGEAKARFEREASLLRSLRHPGHENLVKFVDAGTTETGSPYIAMEYIAGPALRELLREGPLPLLVAVSIARRVCSAYRYLHERDIWRLDVKPGNILLESSGRTVVIDLGVAHLPDVTQITRTGGMIGTPHYMAPEQLDGSGAVDHRCDIYAVGIVLYEMLTGRRARSEALPELVERAKAREVPLSFEDLAEPVPEQIRAVVHRAAAARPADRYPSMNALLAALPPYCISLKDQAAFLESEPSGREGAEPCTAAALTPCTFATLDPISRVEPQSLPGLEVVSGPLHGRYFPIGQGLLIGREPGAELWIEDEVVSRRHARIEPVLGTVVDSAGPVRFSIIDLGSANGTIVNKQVIRRPVFLEDGYRIQIGLDHVFVFHAGAAA